MKKTIIILAIIIMILSLNKEEKVIIPKKSIRFRVIADSNNKKDQDIKKEVVSGLKNKISRLDFSNNLNDNRKMIKEQIPEFKQVVEDTLAKNNYNKQYNIKYGMNYFPEKEYKGTIYKEGEYESLVITLGDGLGRNFWCVLFPPLCLLEAEDTKEVDKVEYKSFIKEVIDKYF
ncbi:MAG: stage II sporulation protein R [Bacilli bacterium]|nr:stage II sporulation protein R [Bacilli bacterium]